MSEKCKKKRNEREQVIVRSNTDSNGRRPTKPVSFADLAHEAQLLSFYGQHNRRRRSLRLDLRSRSVLIAPMFWQSCEETLSGMLT